MSIDNTEEPEQVYRVRLLISTHVFNLAANFTDSDAGRLVQPLINASFLISEAACANLETDKKADSLK